MILLRLMPTAAVTMVVAVTAYADEVEMKRSGIEEVIVSASPHAKTASEIAGSLNVVEGESLQREAAATLGETLQNQIGVHSSSFGPGVGVPVIRGQSGKRVEVLQNSTAVADVSDTSADHAVATEALLADRIEILRGPATLRYGAGAIGGVVNVIDNRIHTSRLEGHEGAAELRHNLNNDETVAVGRFDIGLGNLGIHLDGVTRESNRVEIDGFAAAEADDPDETSDGFIENSDSEADSYSLGLSWIGDKLTAGVSINRIENNYGVPPGGHGHGLHEEEDEGGHEAHGEEEDILTRIDMEQTQYQGKLLFPELDGFFQRLDIDISYNDYEHRELEIAEGESEVGTRFDADSLELRAELVHREVSGWLGAFGIQYSERDFSAVGEEAFVPPSDTERTGVYLLEETQLGDASLELGARFDRQKITSAGINAIEHDSYNLSASLLVPVGESQRAGFVLSHSERAPVAEELLSDGEHVATNTYEIGNAALDEESAVNVELTWVYEGSVNARASLFYTWFNDYIYAMDTELRLSQDLENEGHRGVNACSEELIDFDNDPQEFAEAVECFRYVQEDATFAGVEAELGLTISESQSLRFWGDYVRAELDANGDVPRMPPARLGVSWDFNTDQLSARISVTHALDQDKPGRGQEETDGYTRLDAYLGYRLGGVSLFLKGTNLTNREIRNSTGFLRDLAPEPGRAVSLGVSYRF